MLEEVVEGFSPLLRACLGRQCEESDTVAHLVEGHAPYGGAHQRQYVIAVPFGAQIEYSVGKQAVVREHLDGQTQIIGEWRLKQGEAFGRLVVQVVQGHGSVLDDATKPLPVLLCRTHDAQCEPRTYNTRNNFLFIYFVPFQISFSISFIHVLLVV